MNDLTYSTKAIIKLFADDTCILISARTIKQLQIEVNKEINKVEKWMSSNKLTINYSKTKYMITTKNKKTTSTLSYFQRKNWCMPNYQVPENAKRTP